MSVELRGEPWSTAYYRAKRQATPQWATSEDIGAIYREAKRLRAQGFDVEVDHIVPIRHRYVCGLHCKANLVILHSLENRKKGNHYWPDMWYEQYGFSLEDNRVHQYALPLSL